MEQHDARMAAAVVVEAEGYLRAALAQLGRAAVLADTAELARLSGLVSDATLLAANVSADLRKRAELQNGGEPTCPACSGNGEPIGVRSAFLRCKACGGIYTRRAVRREVAMAFVKLDEMQANTDPENSVYFDFDIRSVAGGDRGAYRVHGWFDRQTKKVVQFG